MTERLSTIDATGTLVLLEGTVTPTMTLKTFAAVNIGGEIWPLSMAYTGIPGRFIGVLRDTLLLPPHGTFVYLYIETDNGPDQRGLMIKQLIVRRRRF